MSIIQSDRSLLAKGYNVSNVCQYPSFAKALSKIYSSEVVVWPLHLTVIILNRDILLFKYLTFA